MDFSRRVMGSVIYERFHMLKTQAYDAFAGCAGMGDSRHQANLPENQSNIALSWQKGLLINGSAKKDVVRMPLKEE
jgi:hypothetical protein